MSLICALFVKYIFIYIYRLEERHSLRSLLLYLSSTLGGGEGRKGETSEWRERERERWGMGSRQGMTRGRERERQDFLSKELDLAFSSLKPLCKTNRGHTSVYRRNTVHTLKNWKKLSQNIFSTYHTIIIIILLLKFLAKQIHNRKSSKGDTENN